MVEEALEPEYRLGYNREVEWGSNEREMGQAREGFVQAADSTVYP